MINLTKKGESHSINLTKESNELSFNLNWNQKTEKKEFKSLFNNLPNSFAKESKLDLDLGCMYKLKDGSKGVIQALGDAFGSLTSKPFIGLDKDDRTGEAENGETLRVLKPENIELMVVFAYIYNGAINWENAKGVITIKQPNNQDIVIKLEDSSSQTMCGIAVLENTNNNLKVRKLENYYNGHIELDNDFGFNFNWKASRK